MYTWHFTWRLHVNRRLIGCSDIFYNTELTYNLITRSDRFLQHGWHTINLSTWNHKLQGLKCKSQLTNKKTRKSLQAMAGRGGRQKRTASARSKDVWRLQTAHQLALPPPPPTPSSSFSSLPKLGRSLLKNSLVIPPIDFMRQLYQSIWDCRASIDPWEATTRSPPPAQAAHRRRRPPSAACAVTTASCPSCSAAPPATSAPSTRTYAVHIIYLYTYAHLSLMYVTTPAYTCNIGFVFVFVRIHAWEIHAFLWNIFGCHRNTIGWPVFIFFRFCWQSWHI